MLLGYAQVLFLDVVRDSEYERLLTFAKIVRDHMQQAGVLKLLSRCKNTL